MKNIKMFSSRVRTVLFGAGLTLSLVAVALLPLEASAAALYRQLDQGESGSDVSDLQTFLALDSTIYPQGLVTGFFGPLTAAAVSNFQTRNGLPAVGRVGPLTLALINQRMTGTVSLAPVIGPASVSVGSANATINWNTTNNTSGIVYYSSSPLAVTEANATAGVGISGSSVLANGDLEVTHSATLSGLSPNTVYYYMIYTRDALGNENVSWPATFTTSS